MTEQSQALSLYDSKDDLRTDAQTWAAQATALQIVDRDSCLQAGTLLKSIKQLRAQVQAFFQPHVDASMEVKRKAETARKALTDERDRMERPLVEAEAIVKRNLLMFEAREEERRLNEEHRIQAEAQARAEQMTREAAERMAAQGLRDGDLGLIAEAESLLEQPTEAPVVHVESSVPKQKGIQYRDHWEIHPDINVKALAAAVGSGDVPEAFLVANVTALNQYARATQGAGNVPGVKFWNNRTIVARG